MRACTLCLIVMSGLRRGGGLMRVGDGLHLVNVVQVQGRASWNIRSHAIRTIWHPTYRSEIGCLAGPSNLPTSSPGPFDHSLESNMLRPSEEAHLTSSPV